MSSPSNYDTEYEQFVHAIGLVCLSKPVSNIPIPLQELLAQQLEHEKQYRNDILIFSLLADNLSNKKRAKQLERIANVINNYPEKKFVLVYDIYENHPELTKVIPMAEFKPDIDILTLFCNSPPTTITVGEKIFNALNKNTIGDLSHIILFHENTFAVVQSDLDHFNALERLLTGFKMVKIT